MIRHVRLSRHTPLTAVTGLRRSGPLAPHRRRHTASGTPARRDDLTPAQRFVLWTRDEGRCVCCGRYVPLNAFDASHRQRRGQGGHNTDLRNRCTMRPECHRTGPLSPDLHPVQARQLGLHVEAWEDYTSIPVTRWDGRRVRLTADGGCREAA